MLVFFLTNSSPLRDTEPQTFGISLTEVLSTFLVIYTITWFTWDKRPVNCYEEQFLKCCLDRLDKKMENFELSHRITKQFLYFTVTTKKTELLCITKTLLVDL